MEFLLKKEIIAPFLIIIVIFVLYNIFKKIIKKLLFLRKLDKRKEKTILMLLNNIIKYIMIIIGGIAILDIYGIDTRALITSFGVVGLVIGLALQDTIKDFVSGMFIVLDNQYGVGDNVTISGFRGEVIFLGLKTTKIKAFTGEVKIINNRNIIEVINHSLENSLAIVDVPVLKEIDVDKVVKLIKEECINLTKYLEGIYGDVSLLGINSISPKIVRYRIIVETVPMENFRIQREIMYAITQMLIKNKIEVSKK